LPAKKEQKSPNNLAEHLLQVFSLHGHVILRQMTLCLWIAIAVVIEQEQEKQTAQTVVAVKCLKAKQHAL